MYSDKEFAERRIARRKEAAKARRKRNAQKLAEQRGYRTY